MALSIGRSNALVLIEKVDLGEAIIFLDINNIVIHMIQTPLQMNPLTIEEPDFLYYVFLDCVLGLAW